MAWTRAALASIAATAVAVAVVSGGTSADPRTPSGLPGLPPPFLGTAVVGSGGLTAAIDAYGNVVDLRAPGPAGRALIDNPADRQAAGTVAADTGIVPRLRIGDRAALPLWRADWVRQRYRPRTNVLVTEAGLGSARAVVTYAAQGSRLACITRSSAGSARLPKDEALTIEANEAHAESRLRCDDARARSIVRAAGRADRRWLSRARPLASAAPGWMRRMYARSLLTLRALTDQRSGAVAAGARDGWAYVWPRDAGTAALAFAAAGYRAEARRVARFLLSLDLGAAARFHGDGTPVAGRGAQGDAWGWTAAAARATGLPHPPQAPPWRNRPDYQESAPDTYLANALASSEPPADGPQPSKWRTSAAHRPRVFRGFETPRGLVRAAGDPGSGLDSAAAWAVRPFAQPALFPAARRTLLRLVAGQNRFGITPGEAWTEADPWSAPTAWSAWSLAALSACERREGSIASASQDRRAALRLFGALRRAATPTGTLPERVDARSGVPRSTTPLAWSHAFAILALLQLWPSRSAFDFDHTPVG